MRLRVALVLSAVLALVAAPATSSSRLRLKSITFCGPDTCWGMPATMMPDGLFDAGHAANAPAFPVRYYRVRLQFAPTGAGRALFMPSLGVFRSGDTWWRVPRQTADTLRRKTRLLRTFGPRRF